MWTMGYNDAGEFNFSESAFNGRKLRPLIPRPLPSVNTTSSSTSASFSRIHGSNDFFTQYQHLATLTDQSKRDFHTPPVVVTSRWNPTPEQLRSLEELYRRGTRTPSADQIQHITAQLRRFGKIEGKNVFYWFQNHKARERQKRRQQMESVTADDQPRHQEIFERKDSGAARTDEYEQTKNWAPPKNCSSLAEESASMERAAKAAVTECRTDGWMQLDEKRRNATWQVMMLSSSPSTIKPSPSCTAAASATATMDLNMNFFLSNPSWKTQNEEEDEEEEEEEDDYDDDNHGCRRDSDQTLQLFPPSSYGSLIKDDEVGGKEGGISTSAINANLVPFPFFEFLPLKN